MPRPDTTTNRKHVVKGEEKHGHNVRYGEYNPSDSIISYNIYQPQSSKPHSSLETFVAERHGQDNAIDMMGAMSRGVPKGLPIHRASDRTVGVRQVVIFKIGPDQMLDRLRLE